MLEGKETEGQNCVRMPNCVKTPLAQKSAPSKGKSWMNLSMFSVKVKVVTRLGSTQRMPGRVKAGGMANNSSLKQRGKWGLACLLTCLSVTSAGIWTPMVSMVFKVWLLFGDFWGCFLGRSGTVTAAHLHPGTGERLGHSTGRILWKYQLEANT